MSFRLSKPDAFSEAVKGQVQKILDDYGIEMPVRVETLYQPEHLSWRVAIRFGAPTKMSLDWAMDDDALKRGGDLESIYPMLDEMIAQDARFTIEVPEWLLQNLVSKR